MTRRSAQGVLGEAARRQRRIHLQRLRDVAAMQGHVDRARAGLVKAQGLIDFGLGAGFDMTSEAAQLDGLRHVVAVAEADLTVARFTAGLANAA